ncbi:hypothetical protein BD626DRAFT_130412 [Schizophyllum amplum]|uniref:Uncharacterized protein n=1 Tax=Schizophyllum amplum TaxID=97359 RepID=A0A550C684_9AGAR|nr:hypothetical protein BD626DRAFT_130412 [Auriculariopsis ampla]
MHDLFRHGIDDVGLSSQGATVGRQSALHWPRILSYIFPVDGRCSVTAQDHSTPVKALSLQTLSCAPSTAQDIDLTMLVRLLFTERAGPQTALPNRVLCERSRQRLGPALSADAALACMETRRRTKMMLWGQAVACCAASGLASDRLSPPLDIGT